MLYLNLENPWNCCYNPDFLKNFLYSLWKRWYHISFFPTFFPQRLFQSSTNCVLPKYSLKSGWKSLLYRWCWPGCVQVFSSSLGTFLIFQPFDFKALKWIQHLSLLWRTSNSMPCLFIGCYVSFLSCLTFLYWHHWETYNFYWIFTALFIFSWF